MTTMMARASFRAGLPARAPSMLFRALHASAPRAGMLTTAPPPGGLASIDPEKFVDGETLKQHQARVRHAEPAQRTYNYAMLGGARFMAASGGRLALVKFLAAMNPAANVMALASLEVDTSNLEAGNCMTVKWRGKPVFIRARTESEITEAEEVNMSELRDPEADADRVQKPEYLVVLGVCTHLGCVPVNGAGDYNGWFCPCHGSHYDTSGRIRKGPAPLNLEVPPYSFLSDTKICVG
jgi:ubiquinol-cytochrome c reductase iron-sulfur subunit